MFPMGPVVEEPRAGSAGGAAPSDIHLGLTPEGGAPVLTGLGPLRTQDRLLVKQKLQTCEILTGCEQENRSDLLITSVNQL